MKDYTEPFDTSQWSKHKYGRFIPFNNAGESFCSTQWTNNGGIEIIPFENEKEPFDTSQCKKEELV